ncbi:MAG TPA: arginine--tRNA ligase, partial [Polyangiaceae bacterium]
SVRLVDLLDEATLRAQSAVREKNPDMPEELREQIAQSVGVGAIKYADLSTERIKDYVFDWSRMLSFEGNTGPYLQYAHARICSILRKAGDDGVRLAKELDMDRLPEDGRISLAHPAERALGLELMEFGVAVRSAGTGLQPHRLCTYLYELATKFTAFFEACPVLKAETPELRESRLLLCGATRRTLALSLELLGIRAPERM